MVTKAVASRTISAHMPVAIPDPVDRQHHRPSSPGWTRELVLQAQELYHDLSRVLPGVRGDERRAGGHNGTSAHPRDRNVFAHELAAAGCIQAGLLPDTAPAVSGWDVAATLEPALQTWGDFFDFIPLPRSRLGIVVADVADKGAGAALYMALTRTLLRSCAPLQPKDPGQVLATVNARILTETQTSMFVTVFYGVLDPGTGTLRYANGGHNPPCLFRSNGRDTLAPTGMALGTLPDRNWETHRATLLPGDTLFLYTDGAIDARAPQGNAFGLERLLSTAQAHLGHPCAEIQAAVLDEIHRFVGRAPRFDDVTLMVVART